MYTCLRYIVNIKCEPTICKSCKTVDANLLLYTI